MHDATRLNRERNALLRKEREKVRHACRIARKTREKVKTCA